MKAHDIYINGYIGDIFDFFGDGNNFTLKKLNEEFASMDADTTEINVHINSGGGLVSEGFAIYDKLASLDITVNTIVEGMCGSIATVIAQAGKKGKRKMYQNSEYFIHNPLWIPSGPDAHTADDLEKLSEDLRKAEDKLIDFYLKNTVASKEDLTAKMKAETTLTSKEAQDLGFIDEVISTDITAFVRYKIAAAVEPRKTNNNNIMADLKAEILNGFARIENLFKGLKPTVVNMAQTLEDGSTIYTDTDTVQVDSKVYTDEELTTPAASGDYTLQDGTTITVVDGVVTVVTPVSAAKTDLEVANEKIAALEAQLAAKETEVTNVKAEKETLEAAVVNIKTEFTNFKNQIVTGQIDLVAANTDAKDVKPVAKVSALDKAAGQIKQRFSQAN